MAARESAGAVARPKARQAGRGPALGAADHAGLRAAPEPMEGLILPHLKPQIVTEGPQLGGTM